MKNKIQFNPFILGIILILGIFGCKSEKKKRLCNFAPHIGIESMKKAKVIFDSNKRQIIASTPKNLFADRGIIKSVPYNTLF